MGEWSRLSTIHFYIILKPRVWFWRHSICLSTIHFYIILKPFAIVDPVARCLSTIHFYIILKPFAIVDPVARCLSTIHFYIILKQEPKEQCWVEQFEYHTFLHHSQTVERSSDSKKWFEYHTFLHHSQTKLQDIILNFSLSTIHFYIILKQCSRTICRTVV